MKFFGEWLLAILVLFLPATAFGGDFPAGQPPVYVFTEDYCPACLGAEKYMKAQGIKYDKFNIDHNQAALNVFQELGARGTPFFVIGHKKETGFDPYVFKTLFDKAKSTTGSSN